MQKIKQLGTVNWTNDELRAAIPDFLALYKNKPISNNQGGMKSPHMFATWFMLKKIKPKFVIESGVWKGQGTWLIEQTLPEAEIFSIDLNLSFREYISEKVHYFDRDFFDIDWSIIPNKADTVLFFDDHQDAVKRIRFGADLGFKQFIFEDNYPAKQGDCYSLKKAFQHAGFTTSVARSKNFKHVIKKLLRPKKNEKILPNPTDCDYLKNILTTYYEFPPVFKKEKTRWGDDWNEADYPTSKALFEEIEQEYLNTFEKEAIHYTWICYAKLK